MRLKWEKETTQVDKTTFRLPLKWRKKLEKVEPEVELPKADVQETLPKKSKRFPVAALIVATGTTFIFLNFMIGMASCGCPSWDMYCKAGRYNKMLGRISIRRLNTAQQAYYLKKGRFAQDNETLAGKDNTYYSYSVRKTDTSAFIFATPHTAYKEKVYIFPFGELHFDIKSELKSWVGGVFAVSNAPGKTVTIICEANSHSTNRPATPIYKNGKLACGAGTKELPHSRVSSS